VEEEGDRRGSGGSGRRRRQEGQRRQWRKKEAVYVHPVLVYDDVNVWQYTTHY
jgi:hypothetical protein